MLLNQVKLIELLNDLTFSVLFTVKKNTDLDGFMNTTNILKELIPLPFSGPFF